MFGDGDGAETLELQAFKIAQNQIKYNGSAPCPQCGVVVSPVEYMYNQGVCNSCRNERTARRVKGKMS
jgi:hypothetical protein